MGGRAPVRLRGVIQFWDKKQSQVVICVYPVTDCAGDLWAQFKDTREQLWQIQVDHDARPSISVNIRRSFEEYLKEASQAGGGSFPDTLAKLQSEAGIKLTMTGTDDTDSLGCFVQYRIAWYVAGGMGALENFFLLFDGYMQYKQKQFAKATPFEVNIHPHSDVDLSSLDEKMTYKPLDFNEPARDLPLKWFEAHPVIGNKIICFHFEPKDESTLHLVITGNTWLSHTTGAEPMYRIRAELLCHFTLRCLIVESSVRVWLYRDDLERHGILGSRGVGGEAYFRYDSI